MRGATFDTIQASLCEQFPNSKNDITADISDVASFFGPQSEDELSNVPSSAAPVGSMSAIKKYARDHGLLTHGTLEINTKCNLRCEHCFHANFTSQGLRFDSITALLTDLRASGVLFLCLTGGELFLRKDALSIIDVANDLGFIIELKTNGTVLTDAHITKLRDMRISDIQVSVYGLEDGYSEFTKSDYMFSTVARNIQTLTQAKIPCSIAYQLTPSNLSSLERAYDILSGLTDNFYFSYYVSPNLGVPTKNFGSRLSFEALKHQVLPKLQSWGMVTEPVRYRYKDCGYVCWAGHEHVFIGSDGTVYPCADLRVPIGNLLTESFLDIVNGRFAALSKFMPTAIPACTDCACHDYCDSCIGIAQLEHGTFLRPSSHKCDLSKLQFERG